MRTLSHYVTEATTFQAMQPIDGNAFATYFQTRLELGIISEDARCERAQTIAFNSSFQPLAEIFAINLATCKPLILKSHSKYSKTNLLRISVVTTKNNLSFQINNLP